MTPGLRLYRAATGLAAPAARAWLARRLAAGKEDPVRWREKLGEPSLARPAGALAWLHGASVGEALSLVPLAQAFGEAGASVLVTSGTRASAQLLASRLPPGAIHQFAPLDVPAAVDRFLDHWRPWAGIFAESELWPNLILAARARGVRLGLVSARLSDASLRGWSRAPAAARGLLAAFELILARDDAAASGLRSLGARVDGVADLKFGAPPLTGAPPPGDGSPLILAASTHEGEDGPILAAFVAARGSHGARLVVVPRHVERGPAIAALAAGLGLSARLRSTGGCECETDVLVADTLGELGLWYRAARLAIVGGGFVAGPGGHNPLEPARIGCPFVSGPKVANWPVFHELAAAGATRLVEPDELASVMGQALAGDPALASMARRAAAFVAPRDAAARAAYPRLLALLGSAAAPERDGEGL